MLDRSIIREIIRDVFRETLIETINTFNPPIAEKSDGNLIRSAVPDLVNEQTTQVVRRRIGASICTGERYSNTLMKPRRAVG